MPIVVNSQKDEATRLYKDGFNFKKNGRLEALTYYEQVYEVNGAYLSALIDVTGSGLQKAQPVARMKPQRNTGKTVANGSIPGFRGIYTL
ncbi:MAG: hypothetical protein L0Z73_13865 [Gammaproteobacteria bacterium]|nr:hypothetical protein [Gammaproteobacteria bacterium]